MGQPFRPIAIALAAATVSLLALVLAAAPTDAADLVLNGYQRIVEPAGEIAPFSGKLTTAPGGAGDRDGASVAGNGLVESSRDYEVLVAIYNATGGERWKNNTGWLTDPNLHRWFGVTLDSNGRVVALDLEENNLRGRLPIEIGDFSRLRHLYLGINQLTGNIPSQIGQLRRLEVLALTENAFLGRIPPEIGRLVRLRQLDLSQNRLTGGIPSELGSLMRLGFLSLDENELTGAIPAELGNATQMRELWLDQNRIAGRIPPQLGQLSKLESLRLGNNQLEGPIPPELGKLRNLESLYLESNHLLGPIPAELGQLSRLRHLWLSHNEISGPVPAELGQLRQLRTLVFDDNYLAGPIPPELGGLPYLEHFQIHRNQLTGPIPPELGNLTTLEGLRLSFNRLTGPIPPELGKLARLQGLHLEANQLQGDIPRELNKLASLRLLYLGGNLLTGCIPSGLLQVRFHDLDRLGLDECEFGLFDLEVEPGVLEPGFAIQRHEYVLRVHSDVAQVALAADGGQARVEFLDGDGLPTIDADPLAPGWQVDLADDVTLLGIRATSVDGSEQAEYSISVRRGFAGRLTVVDNLFVQAPDNEDLKHNIPDLEVDLGGQVVRADFLAHFRATGEIERWGYPTSEVLVLEPGVLTQFYQRGVVDFHNLGAGWVVERRLAWDYVGGGSGGSDDLGVEADVLNPNAGTVSGPWGHKVSNFAIDGTVVGFADFFQRLGGVAAFGYPKTDARVDVVAVGRLRDPATTPGFIRQYYQGGVIEFHAEDEQNPVKLSLLGDTVRAQLVPDWQEEAGFARADALGIRAVFRPEVVG